MPSTRKIAFSLGAFLVLAVILLALAVGIQLVLPQYLESTLLPKLFAETGISEYGFKVRNVGIYGADLGEVRIGPSAEPSLRIGSVQLDYTPDGLYRKKIKRVVIAGIEIYTKLENGKFAFNNLDPQKLMANLQSRKRSRAEPGQASLPIQINRLQIRNATVVLQVNNHLYRIPFEIEITPQKSDDTLFDVHARLFPRGQRIVTRSKIDLAHRRLLLNTEIVGLDLNRFSDIFQAAGGTTAFGKLNLAASAELRMAPFEISKLASDLEIESLMLRTDDFLIRTAGPESLRTTLTADYHPDGRWQLKLIAHKGRNVPAGSIRLQVNQYEVTSQFPLLKIAGQPQNDGMAVTYSIDIANTRLDTGAETFRLPKTVIKGHTDFSAGGKASSAEKIELHTLGAHLSSAAGKISINKASLAGKIHQITGGKRGFRGMLRFSGGILVPADIDGRIDDVSGSIPLIWPPGNNQQKGQISIAALPYKRKDLGRGQFQIQQTATGFKIDGRLSSDQLSHTSFKLEGRSHIFYTKRPSINGRFSITRPAGAPSVDLSSLHPDAKGITVKGKFLSEGKFSLDGAGFSGSVQSQLINGKVAMPENQLVIQGVQLSLEIPNLPEPRSAPGQKLRFAKLSLGSLTTENGKIDYQIESLNTLLIEKSQFDWSGGKVDTQAIRLSRGTEDYNINFYCDRLNLAKVLEQFGAAAAEGDGSVSGRIPIRYAKGRLSFDDGFLFSTPGAGGKIRLTGTEILTAGIPPNTPQFAQMELAREALKDYDYAWAKLRLNSEGEILLLQMQMDGKPAKTLPFVYKKDIGGFIKVEADTKGSRFQGIRLDVNFRLPLNKLLQYKDLIKMIQ